MVNTSKWPITVDGVRLDTLAWNIETRTGRDGEAQLAGENLDTGMRDGVIWTPNKKRGAGRLVLSMWVGGTDEDGAVPVDNDDYWKYTQNLDALKRMFGVTHRQLDVRLQMDAAGAHIRQALCEKTTMITPEMFASYPYTAKFAVELTIPGAFLQDVADSNYDSQAVDFPGGIPANTTVTLPDPFPAATAPMRDMYVVLDGPATNPKILDPRNGHSIQLNSAISGGIQWVVNTATWSSKTGAAIAFTDTGTDRYDVTQFAGGHSPKMFGITADPLGPQIRVEGTGFGAATRLRVRTKIQYL